MLALFGGDPAVHLPHPHGLWPRYSKQVKEAIRDYVIQDGDLSISDRVGVVKDLEDKFIEYYGSTYALLTNSGSNALHAAFIAIGLEPGDEIIAPTYAFHACITSAIHRQAVPVLCDSESDSVNIDPFLLEEKITSKTRAIVVVHNWGHPVDLKTIRAIADKHGLYLIEDCSHAHGSEYCDQKVGTFGDISCFSLQANKLVCAGEGGLLLTNNRDLYERACLVGHYRGRSYSTIKSKFYKQFAETGYGLKYRIHPLGAVIAKQFLEDLESEIDRRNHLMSRMNQLLNDIPIFKPPTLRAYTTRHSYYGYKPTVIQENLDGIPVDTLIKALQAEGVEIHKPTFRPIHQLELYQRKHTKLFMSMPDNWRTYKNGEFSNIEKLIDNLLSIVIPTGENDELLLSQYCDAFEKVAAKLEDLRTRDIKLHDDDLNRRGGIASMEPWWVSNYNNTDYITSYSDRTVDVTKREISFIERKIPIHENSLIVDVCCANGRHAIEFAKRGYNNVIGIDLSNVLLSEAAKEADQLGLTIEWKNEDMRNLGDLQADLIMNLFSSFGFFEDDRENYQFFHSVFNALKPGGYFFFDIFHRESTVRNFKEKDWNETDSHIVLKSNQFDYLSSRIQRRTKVIDKYNPLSHSERISSMRSFTIQEIRTAIQNAGLNLLQMFGKYEDTLFDAKTSKRLIVISQKPCDLN